MAKINVSATSLEFAESLVGYPTEMGPLGGVYCIHYKPE